MSGNSSLLGPLDLPVAREDTESRHPNSVVREDLLRQRLVAGQKKPARVASGVGGPLELQVTDDVRVEDRFAIELLEEIEHDVRLELLDRGPKRGQLVAQADHYHVVSEPAQPLAHVELGLERGDLCRGKRADVFGGDETLVHENDDSPSL